MIKVGYRYRVSYHISGCCNHTIQILNIAENRINYQYILGNEDVSCRIEKVLGDYNYITSRDLNRFQEKIDTGNIILAEELIIKPHETKNTNRLTLIFDS